MGVPLPKCRNGVGGVACVGVLLEANNSLNASGRVPPDLPQRRLCPRTDAEVRDAHGIQEQHRGYRNRPGNRLLRAPWSALAAHADSCGDLVSTGKRAPQSATGPRPNCRSAGPSHREHDDPSPAHCHRSATALKTRPSDRCGLWGPPRPSWPSSDRKRSPDDPGPGTVLCLGRPSAR